MGDPITTGLILGGISAAASGAGASSANKRVNQARDAEIASQDIAAQQRKAITARQLQTLEGSIRASSAGRGVAGSRVETSILGSAFESALLEGSNIEINRFTQEAATRARAESQQQSPLLAGVSGFQSGFGFGNSLGSLDFSSFFGGGGGIGNNAGSLLPNADQLSGIAIT
tara:strand:+ start:1784 stop:2299 length:516 start_codon:yes stop_codon:yes gene_type:complete